MRPRLMCVWVQHGLMLIIFSSSWRQAKPRLNHIENDLLNNFRRLGVIATTMNGKERLHLMHSMFHMSRNYEFTYPEQVMIYAQRPNATFCKPYEDWNAENYRRYLPMIPPTIFCVLWKMWMRTAI